MTEPGPRVGEDDRSAELRRRIQSHLATTLAGLTAAMGAATLLIALADCLDSSGWLHDLLLGSALLACTLAVAVVAVVSASRELRCPACERRVWMQVAWHRGAFGILAAKHCRGCGVRLFPDRLSPMRRIALFASLIGVASAVAVALWL